MKMQPVSVGSTGSARGGPRSGLCAVRPGIWISLALCFCLLLVYRQIRHHDFINFDDDRYVVENPHVATGLTPGNIRWALTATAESNWHPVTWVSHMLDCTLYGKNPGRHHAVNLFLHIANTLLLFVLLRKMTGLVWPSALAAAVFGLHPLQVESVAWISERKNLLCTFFGLLTLGAYHRYVRSPRRINFLPVAVFFALGLMAKPMLVTLPLVMVLLDFWPLGRFGFRPPRDRFSVWESLREKIPLLFLSALSSGVTLAAQNAGGAIPSLAAYPLGARIANAILSYAAYLGMFFRPLDLAPFYPLAAEVSMGKTAAALGLLAGISAAVLKSRRPRPYLVVGWLWYLGTLIPMIGLVQVGAQAMADRYMYLPMIGLLLMSAYALSDAAGTTPSRRAWAVVSAGGFLCVLSLITWQQAGFWKDSETLFTRTLHIIPDNPVAHNNLGLALAAAGKQKAAVSHFRAALRIDPGYPPAHVNLANALAADGRLPEAERHYARAMELNPHNPVAFKNRGLVMVRMGALEKAAMLFEQAIAADPHYPDAHSDLGVTLAIQGRITEAIAHFEAALRLDPTHAKAANALNIARAVQAEGKGTPREE